jgi:short-subunit dehydrogenase
MKILITGASSGIGEELAKRYSSPENHLYLIARSCEKLEVLKKELQNVTPICKDLSNLEEASALGEELPELDLLIFNAGISLGHDSKHFTSSADFERLFSINFLSIHRTMEKLYPKLKSGSKIVFISSLASIISLPSSIAYSTSKRALNSYAEGLRYFLKPKGVEVLNILPGFIVTPLTDKNGFKMPFLLSLEKGVDRIEKAIQKGKVSYAFPKRFYFLIKFISFLPTQIRDRVIEFVKK